MKRPAKPATLVILTAMAVFAVLFPFLGSGTGQLIANNGEVPQPGPEADASQMFEEGRETFRFDTFRDEAYWGDALKLHQAIAGDEHYRTTPLKGLWTHTKGGFYHDGRFATLNDVLKHYNGQFKLALTEPETSDLIEYLKSL
jgi:hypothetical protein